MILEQLLQELIPVVEDNIEIALRNDIVETGPDIDLLPAILRQRTKSERPPLSRPSDKEQLQRYRDKETLVKATLTENIKRHIG